MDTPRKSGMERQLEIYLQGMVGQRSTIPVPLALLEQKAMQVLPVTAYDYVAGGAAGELTMRANREAFFRWRIVPRMLRNVSERDPGCELLGMKLRAPVLLAPVGVQGILHAEGEVASARGAASVGVPFTLSTLSSRSMEEVAEALAGGIGWFQLYWGKNPELTASFLARAEKAAFQAVVVTLDTAMLAWRERDLNNGYLPFLRGEGLTNYFTDPVFRAALAKPPKEDPVPAIQLWSSIFSNTSLTWRDLKWLRSKTRLPILLKGILHGDDAMRAVDAGVDGIIVSNHGGRQVDGAVATLDALPEVVAAVKGRIPVLLDSGIRNGSDAIKAIALGARAVLLGRLYAWGLAVGGEAGVSEVLQNFIADFDLTLALSGFRSLAELEPSILARAV